MCLWRLSVVHVILMRVKLGPLASSALNWKKNWRSLSEERWNIFKIATSPVCPNLTLLSQKLSNQFHTALGGEPVSAVGVAACLWLRVASAFSTPAAETDGSTGSPSGPIMTHCPVAGDWHSAITLQFSVHFISNLALCNLPSRLRHFLNLLSQIKPPKTGSWLDTQLWEMFEGKTIMLWFLYLENEGVGHPEKISCIQTSTNLESRRESWMRNIWRNRPWRSPILPWESTSLFLHQITLYYTSMFLFMIIALLLFQIKSIKSATRTYFHIRLIYFITEIQFFILFFIHMLCMCAFARILFCSFFLSWPSFLKPTKTSRSIPLLTVM